MMLLFSLKLLTWVIRFVGSAKKVKHRNAEMNKINYSDFVTCAEAMASVF